MSLVGHTRAVHRKHCTNGKPLIGSVSKCLACWNPTRQVIQCYVITALKRMIWVARVDLRDHDPILDWSTRMKERVFTEALKELAPIGSQLSYTEKKDRRTRESLYFASGLSFDGHELWSKVQERQFPW